MQIGKSRIRVLILLAAFMLPLAAGTRAQAAAPKTGAGEKPAIVLVHGAFVDGSSWQEVIPILQRSGYTVAAAQLPLTAFNDDVAFAKRLIERQKGQVVVVGHSYGGGVISEAAAKNPNVKALVYIAAYALDIGESANDLNAKFPKTQLADALVPDAAGFLYIDPAKFRPVFAQDLSEKQTAVLAAVQKPIFKETFAAPGKDPAWKTVPSWYLVTTEDHALNPDLQRFMAKRMSAHITEIKANHAVIASQPKEVVKIIEAAVREETAMTAPK
ncbi:MAG: hypothetical protein JWO30_430 [Fibrobacteres bacterium]|nr:hypothetical protein [Fibrobacterota bacterium]